MLQASNYSKVQIILCLTGKKVAQLEFLAEKTSPLHLAHGGIRSDGDEYQLYWHFDALIGAEDGGEIDSLNLELF